MKKKLFLVGVIALLCGGAAYLYLGRTSTTSAPTQPTHGAPSAAGGTVSPRTPAPELRVCGLRPGEEVDFDFSLGTDLSYDPAAMMGSLIKQATLLQKQSYRVTGRWSLRVLEIGGRAESALAVSAFTGMRIEDVQSGASIAADTELTRPFLLKISPDCRFSEQGSPAGLSAKAAAQLRRTVQLYEFALSLDPRAREWVASQYDDTGEYLAAYERAGDSVTRRRTRYTSLWDRGDKQQKDPKSDARIEQTSLAATLEPSRPWVRSLSGIEQTAMTTDGKVYFRSRMTLKLDAVDGRTSVLAGFAYDPNAWVWSLASAPPPEIPEDTSGDPSLAGVPPDVLLEKYLELIRAGDARSAREAVELLTAYLRVHPEFAFELLARLERGEIDGKAAAPIFFALEKAGTAEAQKALQQALVSDKLSLENRSRAASALSDVPKPTRETVQALIEMSTTKVGEGNDAGIVANGATLALGHLDKRLRDANDFGLATQIRDELARRLGEESPGLGLGDVLSAVGNSGDTDLLEAVKPYLTANETATRWKAAEAMRLMDPTKTASMFKSLLDGEEDWMARTALVTSYTEQAKTSGKPVLAEVVAVAAARLPLESSSRVRGQLIELLGLASTTDLVARKALIAHFANEKDPSLLLAIGRFIQAHELP